MGTYALSLHLRWIYLLLVTAFAPALTVWLWWLAESFEMFGVKQDALGVRVVSFQVRGLLKSDGPEDSEAKAKARWWLVADATSFVSTLTETDCRVIHCEVSNRLQNDASN